MFVLIATSVLQHVCVQGTNMYFGGHSAMLLNNSFCSTAEKGTLCVWASSASISQFLVVAEGMVQVCGA